MSASRETWSKILVGTGYAAMLAGAVDFMEGSVLILPGSALVLAGTWLSSPARRFLKYRLTVFVLLAVGIGALLGTSALGGFGGKSGLSWWWGVLIVPYVVGWPMGILGPGNPRWVHYAGIAIGLWLIALPVIIVRAAMMHPGRPFFPGVLALVAAFGVLTTAGCAWRLRQRAPQ